MVEDAIVIRCTTGETLGINAQHGDPAVMFEYDPETKRVHVLAKFYRREDAIRAIRLIRNMGQEEPQLDRSAT